MKKRLSAAALTAAMTASLLAGCGSSAQQAAGGSTAAAAEAKTASGDTAAPETAGKGDGKTIKIGVICSMTGGSAIYGEGAQNAIDMAAEEIKSMRS